MLMAVLKPLPNIHFYVLNCVLSKSISQSDLLPLPRNSRSYTTFWVSNTYYLRDCVDSPKRSEPYLFLVLVHRQLLIGWKEVFLEKKVYLFSNVRICPVLTRINRSNGVSYFGHSSSICQISIWGFLTSWRDIHMVIFESWETYLKKRGKHC